MSLHLQCKESVALVFDITIKRIAFRSGGRESQSFLRKKIRQDRNLSKQKKSDTSNTKARQAGVWLEHAPRHNSRSQHLLEDWLLIWWRRRFIIIILLGSLWDSRKQKYLPHKRASPRRRGVNVGKIVQLISGLSNQPEDVVCCRYSAGDTFIASWQSN